MLFNSFFFLPVGLVLNLFGQHSASQLIRVAYFDVCVLFLMRIGVDVC